MFFKQVQRNAAKNRKGNGLFFSSLIIAIVAFYTLLSLGDQDVRRFPVLCIFSCLFRLQIPDGQPQARAWHVSDAWHEAQSYVFDVIL